MSPHTSNREAAPAHGAASEDADRIGSAAEGSAAAAVRTSRPDMLRWVASLAFLGLFLAMIAIFSALRPEFFPTLSNAEAILQQAAILAVLGVGLTIVLVIGDFDLSFDQNAALSGAVAVALMTNVDMSTGIGILAGIATGAAVGIVNGTLVAFGRAPAFIATLAVASVAGGMQAWVTGNKTVYGVPEAYIGISTANVLGIPLFVWISIGAVLAVAGLLRYTVYGRHAHAVGSNVVAAGSAGIRTRRVRWTAFVLMGALAGLAGILITSQAGGASPSNSANLLLPVYTAAFLGASAIGRGQFNAIGTYFGVLFIGTLATGLTMMQQEAWVANVITGLVLVVAVLVARRK